VAIDREAALKKAEKFLRQGKLDGAIEEYVRLVEDQPRDWNAINALGDLYVRAGDDDRAVEQFTRIADYLFAEGFFPKAAALYKKALKVKNSHEPTLLRLGEIAAQQGLLADAKTYFKQLAEQRKRRGDHKGAAECLVRLAMIDQADPESIPLLVEAARLDPGVLTAESAGDNPDLLLALAKTELADGRDNEAKALLMRVLTIASDRHDAVLQFGLELARNGDVSRAYPCIELLADASLLDGQWQRAASDLRAFGEQVGHVPALMRLVEICVDAGDDGGLRDAQALLADAYLKEGRGAEARVVAEDLALHDPSSEAHLGRLRAALQMLGVTDVEQAITDRLHPDATLSVLTEDFDLDLLEPAEPAPVPPPVQKPVAPQREPVAPQREPVDEPFVLDTVEIDLSTALADIGSPALPPPTPASPAAAAAADSAASPAGPTRDLESVFEDIRTRVEREQQSSDVEAQFERGLAYLGEGRTEEAISELQAAARTPMYRFKAAAQLGRLHVAAGNVKTGIEWFERAAEAPAPTPDDGFAVLYELAAGLEQLGETARALAILIELDADAGDYRDVRQRIGSLTREQAGSRGA
jgi:tetratricopeptide (TPR) repeat protein